MRASALESTQKAAVERAKAITENLGGGEVRVQRRADARFRDGEKAKKR
jgi:hypothetical protein